jgi:hypothetical protein
MIVMAHHSARTSRSRRSSALRGPVGRPGRGEHSGPEADRTRGKAPLTARRAARPARPELVPAGQAGVGSGAGQLVDGEPLHAGRAEGRAWSGRDAEARLVRSPRRSSSASAGSRSPTGRPAPAHLPPDARPAAGAARRLSAPPARRAGRRPRWRRRVGAHSAHLRRGRARRPGLACRGSRAGRAARRPRTQRPAGPATPGAVKLANQAGRPGIVDAVHRLAGDARATRVGDDEAW